MYEHNVIVENSFIDRIYSRCSLGYLELVVDEVAEVAVEQRTLTIPISMEIHSLVVAKAKAKGKLVQLNPETNLHNFCNFFL